MKLLLRPPLEYEWPICRMLLPEAPVGDPAQQFLLCLREESPRVVAAASFRQLPQAVADLRVHVISPLRRRGVGRQIVAHLAREGTRSVSGSIDLIRQPEALPFCEALGFKRTETITTVEAELAQMREYLRALSSKRQSPVRIVPLAQVSAARVAELHARYVAQHDDSAHWRAMLAGTIDAQGSVAALIDDSVVGALLGVIEGDTAVIRSKFAVPGPHRAWVNLLLMMEALEGAWPRGAHRVRFSFDSSNRDTQKMTRRLNAQITELVALVTLAGQPSG